MDRTDSASKAGLHHMSRVFAHHFATRGITSNTIACGAFETKSAPVHGIWADFADAFGCAVMKATLDAFGEAIKEGTPLGRIGEGADIIGTCLYLSSQAGAFVTGCACLHSARRFLNSHSATIPLDGGVLIRAHMVCRCRPPHTGCCSSPRTVMS